MKEMFPQMCVICIPDIVALNRFVLYCEQIGVRWDATNPMRNAIKFIGSYLERHDDVCINVRRHNGEIYFGYCYADYYDNSSYLNQIDQRWNFCSVEEFIDWTGGWLVDDAEDVFDFTTIL